MTREDVPDDIFIYTRYSDEQQSHDTLESQERKTREGLTARGIDHSKAVVLRDAAISGTKDSRPAFNRLLALVHNGGRVLVAVDDQSRFSRGVNVKAFIIDIIFNKGRFISTGEHVDTAKEGWEDLVDIYGIHHRKCSVETGRRTRRGVEHRAMSDNLSDGSIPYGYDSEYRGNDWLNELKKGKRPPKLVLIHEDQAKWVREMFRLYAVDMLSTVQIARRFNQLGVPRDGRKAKSKVWCEQTVGQNLRNRKYIGEWHWGSKRIVKNSRGEPRAEKVRNQPVTSVRPAMRIVCQEHWEVAQKRLEAMKQKLAPKTPVPYSRREHPLHNLGHLVTCGECGRPLWTMVQKGYGPSMYCENRKLGVCCMARMVRVWRIEEVVYGFLKEITEVLPDWFNKVRAAARDVVASAQTALSPIPVMQAERSKLRRQIDNVVAEIRQGCGSRSLRDELGRLEAEEERLEITIRKAKVAPAPTMPTDAEIHRHLAELPELLKEPNRATAHLLKQIFTRMELCEVLVNGQKSQELLLKVQLNPEALLSFGMTGKVSGELADIPRSAEPVEHVLTVDCRARMEVWGPKIAEMRQQKMPWDQIARLTGLHENTARAALRKWGQPPDRKNTA